MNKLIDLNENNIKNKIYAIRNIQVMLDSDLAKLYSISTKGLNQAVKRNNDRFPYSFMFQLTEKELKLLRCHFGSTNNSTNLKFQNGTSSWGGKRYLPYVFTEQGVAMLSGILKTKTAIEVSIQIIDSFVSMRRFLTKNAHIFQRLDNIEIKQLESDQKFKKIFDAIEDKDIKAKQGIFFDGQVFDAHKFVSDIIRTAKKTITLIDNYIDDIVLTLLNKRKKNIKVTILTNNISKELTLDLKKYNTQYTPIIIKEFKNSHDRFLIIDNKDIYHFGTSLKDLGKKWFAFSKFDKNHFSFLERIKKD